MAACQMDLHTKASEPDANEMLGALLSAGLAAKKHSPDGGKTWTISIDDRDAVRAIDVLRTNALPRARRATMGELFKKEGLVSSPSEERVRFIFGVEQELAETVSRIDGVMVARVHIVLPNNDPLASNVKPSSASVFVKHQRNADLQAMVPAIKNLVLHAVEGLDYNRVTVTLVAAAAQAAKAPGAAANAGASAAAAPTEHSPWLPVGSVAAVAVLLLGGGIALKRSGRWPALAALGSRQARHKAPSARQGS
jgi:type III secretion protein J